MIYDIRDEYLLINDPARTRRIYLIFRRDGSVGSRGMGSWGLLGRNADA